MTDDTPEAGAPDAPDADAVARLLEPFVGEIEAVHSLDDVAARYDLDMGTLTRQWRALGFPDPRPGEKVLSEAEADLIGQVTTAFFEEARDEAVSLHIWRVIASSLDRIASAQVDALVERAAAVRDDPWARVRVARSSAVMPRLLEMVWRRRLAVEVQRRLMRQQVGAGVPLLVGFVDLVGFTAQTAQLDVARLAEVVERFEAIAYDVVPARGGRVVKTIGDEVLFVNDDVVEGCRTALDLAQRYQDDDALSEVRVGLAHGQVLERDGDVFGPPVNKASRIVSSSFPGLVVISSDVHDLVRDVEEFAFVAMRPKFLKDLGQVELWRLQRADDPLEQAVRSVRLDLAGRHDQRRGRWEAQRREALERAEATVASFGDDLSTLPERLQAIAGDATPEVLSRALADPASRGLEWLGGAVLRSDLDPEVQEELITELATARALREVQLEVEAMAVEADDEAETELRRIEREMAASLKELERDRRERLAQIIATATEAAAAVDEQAARRLHEVTDEADRKARDANRIAREKARAVRERFER